MDTPNFFYLVSFFKHFIKKKFNMYFDKQTIQKKFLLSSSQNVANVVTKLAIFQKPKKNILHEAKNAILFFF